MRSRQPLHIALVAPAGDDAPPPRAVRALAPALRAHGIDVTLLPAPTTAADTRRAQAGHIWPRARTLRLALRRDGARLALSFTVPDHLALSLATLGRPTRAILWQAALPAWSTTAASRWFWRLLPLLVKRAGTALAAPNAPLVETLARRAGVPAGMVARLPLPLPDDAESLPQAPPDLLSRPPVILFPAPLERAMQPGMAVRAFGLLEDESARLVLPATGTSERAIRHMVEHLGLRRRVTFVPPREIGGWFDKARLCCLPPRIDPFGLYALRALAHGLPVVGTRIPALVDIIGHDPALGTLVETTDTEGLGHALARRLRHPGEAAPRLRRARDFSPARIAEEWKERISHIAND